MKHLFLSILACNLGAISTLQSKFGSRLLQSARNFNSNHNDYTAKGLKLATGGTLLVSFGALGNDVYNSYVRDKKTINLLEENFKKKAILFEPKHQAILTDLAKPMYHSNKPLYFSFGGKSNNGIATQFEDSNYITLCDTDFDGICSRRPESIFLRSSHENRATYEQRMIDYDEAQDRSHVLEYYNSKGIGKLTVQQLHTMRHELGHINFNHGPKSCRDTKKMRVIALGAGLIVHPYVMRNFLSKTTTKTVLLGKICLLGLSTSILKAGRFFTERLMSRKLERQADAFALAHASSIEELNREKEYYSVRAKEEQEHVSLLKKGIFSGITYLKSCKSIKQIQWWTKGMYHICREFVEDRYFSTHPSDEERAQTIEREIEKRKQNIC